MIETAHALVAELSTFPRSSVTQRNQTPSRVNQPARKEAAGLEMVRVLWCGVIMIGAPIPRCDARYPTMNRSTSSPNDLGKYDSLLFWLIGKISWSLSSKKTLEVKILFLTLTIEWRSIIDECFNEHCRWGFMQHTNMKPTCEEHGPLTESSNVRENRVVSE